MALTYPGFVEVERHKFTLIKDAITLILAFGVLFLCVSFIFNGYLVQRLDLNTTIINLILLGILVFAIISSYVRWKSVHYFVGNKQILLRQGIITPKETILEKDYDLVVTIHQSLIQKSFKSGDLKFYDRDSDKTFVMRDIVEPRKAYAVLMGNEQVMTASKDGMYADQVFDQTHDQTTNHAAMAAGATAGAVAGQNVGNQPDSGYIQQNSFQNQPQPGLQKAPNAYIAPNNVQEQDNNSNMGAAVAAGAAAGVAAHAISESREEDTSEATEANQNEIVNSLDMIETQGEVQDEPYVDVTDEYQVPEYLQEAPQTEPQPVYEAYEYSETTTVDENNNSRTFSEETELTITLERDGFEDEEDESPKFSDSHGIQEFEL